MNIGTIPEAVNIQINGKLIGGVTYPPDCTIKVDYKNGMKEGEGLLLSPKRMKLAKLHYHEDKLDGLCLFYDLNGFITKEAFFENDVQNGWGCEYKNDKVVFEGFYRNGKRFSELMKYSEGSNLMKEIKDDKTLSICRYNNDHKKDGVGYLFENNKMKSCVIFDNGIVKKKLQEFIDYQMIEYDDHETVIYKGYYKGNLNRGFTRSGEGIELKYSHGKLCEAIKVKDGKNTGRCVLNGTEMKEYDGENLVYEGEFSLKDGSVLRNGIGIVYSFRKDFNSVLYDNGVEKRKMNNIEEKVMKEFDEEGRVVYKGEFEKTGNSFKRKGKGEVFVYDRKKVKEVYACENGVVKGKVREFQGSLMLEFNANNQVIYQGGFRGDLYLGYIHAGKKQSFEYGDDGIIREYAGNSLVYEGEYTWSDGLYQRHGLGRVFTSSTVSYTAIFEQGVQKRCLQQIEGEIMKELDEEGKVVYKGGFERIGKSYKRKGKGVLYEYTGKKVKEVYACENGDKTVKYLMLDKDEMSELNEDGMIVYRGSFLGNPNDGYVRNGSGDEFDKNDMLMYSGEWKNGKREGKGLFYVNGDVRYSGEWRDNSPNGVGKLYTTDGKVAYEGPWKNGYHTIKKGIAISYLTLCKKEFYNNGSILYEGEWNDFKYEGKGKLYYRNGIIEYEGNFFNGLRSGLGKEYFVSGGLKYEGRFVKGLHQGSGKLYNENGHIKYEGSFIGDMYDRSGKLYNENGHIMYEGGFKNGLYEGAGEEYYDNGQIKYEGDFKNNEYSGSGKKYDKEGNLDYEGEWIASIPNGYGKCYYDSRVYEGEWKDGKVLSRAQGCWFDYQTREKTSVISLFWKYVREGISYLYKKGWFSLFAILVIGVILFLYDNIAAFIAGIVSVCEFAFLLLIWLLVASHDYEPPCDCIIHEECWDCNGKHTDCLHMFVFFILDVYVMIAKCLWIGFCIIFYVSEYPVIAYAIPISVFFLHIILGVLSFVCSLHLQRILWVIYYGDD